MSLPGSIDSASIIDLLAGPCANGVKQPEAEFAVGLLDLVGAQHGFFAQRLHHVHDPRRVVVGRQVDDPFGRFQ